MSGYGIIPVSPDSIVTGVSSADVSATNGTSFASDTVEVTFRWPGNALSVQWDNNLIQDNTTVQITPKMDLARVRSSYSSVVTAGSVNLVRSSGSVVDEKGTAKLGGTPT